MVSKVKYHYTYKICPVLRHRAEFFKVKTERGKIEMVASRQPFLFSVIAIHRAVGAYGRKGEDCIAKEL